MNGAISTISNTVTDYGKVYSMISAIISTILAIILIVMSIILIMKKHNKTSIVQGIITSSRCNEYSLYSETSYECQLTVSYVVNGKKYSRIINTKGPIKYVTNSLIELDYDPNNPTDVQIKSIGSRKLAIILIIIAVILLSFSWGYYYLVLKYPSFALFAGTEDIMRAL